MRKGLCMDRKEMKSPNNKNIKRCPWCGKPLCNSGKITHKLRLGMSPVSVCPQCSNACSSSLSTSILLFLILIVWSFFAGNLLEFIITIFLLALSVTVSILLSLSGRYNIYKIDANGKKMEEGGIIYTGTITDRQNSERLKKAILVTDRDFDKKPEFSGASPIEVRKYSTKSGAIEFRFLYEHSCNRDLIEGGELEVYYLDNTLKIVGVAPKKK